MKFTATGAALAAAFVISPAHAGDALVVEGAPTPTALVRTADLDLRAAEGIERLHARVRRAAARLCYDGSRITLADELAGRPCRDRAIEEAAPQIARAISLRTAGFAASGPIAVTLR